MIETVNGRPFVPGHMVMHNGPGWEAVRADGRWIPNDLYTTNPTVLSTVAKPGVAAQAVVVPWNLIEPRRRQYELGILEAQVAYLERHHPGQGILFQVNDRSYPTAPAKVVPDWLTDLGLELPCQRAGGGTVAARWIPEVADALVDVHTAICERFKGSPSFLGTGMQETAVGLSDEQIRDPSIGYTPGGYAVALRMIAIAIASRNPTARLWFYMNFLQGPGGQALLRDLVLELAAEPWGCAIGGPDVLPNNRALLEQVYAIYAALPAEAIAFCSAQYDSFRHRKPGQVEAWYSPAEIAAYARDVLGVHTLIWNNSSSTTPYTIDDAWPVIESTRLVELPRPPAVDPTAPCQVCGRTDQLPLAVRDFLIEEFETSNDRADRIAGLLDDGTTSG